MNSHLTPQGLVDLTKKKPRPIFDSSFRPQVWCKAINDWTSPATEPPITFPGAFEKFLSSLYNLRITYPDKDIYLGDDDVSGAFRLLKYHPNLVAMHASIQCGMLVLNTGGTFGDNTTPPNWDTFSVVRQKMSQARWRDPSVVHQAAAFMPPISFTPDPTPAEVAQFVQAEPDVLNQGVLDANGERLPPPYPHHVDDNMWADVREFVPRTAAASIMGMYDAFGAPTPAGNPDPASWEKFTALFSCARPEVGHSVNSRTQVVSLLSDKRGNLVSTLAQWLTFQDFDIRMIASLSGDIESASRYCRWGRVWFAVIRGVLGEILKVRYHIVSRRYRTEERRAAVQKQLPRELEHRLGSIIAKEKAALLWSVGGRFKMQQCILDCLRPLHDYLADSQNRWEEPIAFIIPRMSHFESFGDASFDGGGAYCPVLRYWFDLVWSPDVLGRTKLASTDPRYVHINALEMVVVVLQFAAAVVRIQELRGDKDKARQSFPRGVPLHPIARCRCDNLVSTSWASRVSARNSKHGVALTAIYGELLRTSHVGDRTDHIAGEHNDVADYISRPSDKNLSHAARAEQIFRQHASLRTYDFFLPSPGLLRLLSLSISSAPPPGVPKMPRSLGRFVPAGSTISASPMI